MILGSENKLSRKNLLLVFFLYFILTILVTYPLIFNFSKGVLGTQGQEDSRIYLWEISQFGEKIFKEHANPLTAENIFYPRGLHFQDMNFTLSAIIVSPLGILLNPTIAYNFWIFFGYVAAGFFAFLLVFHLFKNIWASFIVGAIFSFSSYHYQVAYNGELELSGIFWFPLILYFLILFLESKQIKYAIALSVSFVLAALSSGYYGAFSILLIAIFTIFYFIFNKMCI